MFFMNNETNDANSDVTLELVQKLQEIKDRCEMPPGISYRTFYLLLLACSFIQYVAHRLVAESVDWDSLRFSYGLLPLEILMMRNAIVPVLLPIVVLFFFLLSFKFKFVRSPRFLAWFALILFGFSASHAWVSGMFSFNLLSRLAQ